MTDNCGAMSDFPSGFAQPLSSTTEQAVQRQEEPVTLNLDDIFGNYFFMPDSEAVFLSETETPGAILSSGEIITAPVASRPVPMVVQSAPPQQTFVPVPLAGGIATTGLQNPNAISTVMGPPVNGAPVPSVPIAQPPQQRHHLQFATVTSTGASVKPNKGSAAGSSVSARERKMNDQQKSERR